MAQSYRSWRDQYEGEWETKFRQTYERRMIDVLDTHFFVGTIHRHPREMDHRRAVLPAAPGHARSI
jgi:hypothetical protein